ncbi:caspase domain-containing protein [Mycena rebaudengoi]|nr:caspase domain-containing protein [Mycena rebaudengoi]
MQQSDTSETVASDISTTDRLTGPHDDAKCFKSLLIKLGYKEGDIVVLIDDPDAGPEFQPTYTNIMRELDRFMSGQKPGDKFVFGYAGHCYQKPNIDGTEYDGLDEFIIPSDASNFMKDNPDYSQVILDDVLKQKLIEPLLPGSQLIAVLDTCHSATLLDLEHDKCNRSGSLSSLARRSFRRIRESFQADNVEFNAESVIGCSKVATKPRPNFCSGYCCRPWIPSPMRVPVLCFSACKDSQEVFEDPEGKSLMRTFVDVLSRNPAPTLAELMTACSSKSLATLRDLRKEAKGVGKFLPWRPQLSSLQPLHLQARLSL